MTAPSRRPARWRRACRARARPGTTAPQGGDAAARSRCGSWRRRSAGGPRRAGPSPRCARAAGAPPRREPEPGREVAAAGGGSRVRDEGPDRRRADRPDAGHGAAEPRGVAAGAHLLHQPADPGRRRRDAVEVRSAPFRASRGTRPIPAGATRPNSAGSPPRDHGLGPPLDELSARPDQYGARPCPGRFRGGGAHVGPRGRLGAVPAPSTAPEPRACGPKGRGAEPGWPDRAASRPRGRDRPSRGPSREGPDREASPAPRCRRRTRGSRGRTRTSRRARR